MVVAEGTVLQVEVQVVLAGVVEGLVGRVEEVEVLVAMALVQGLAGLAAMRLRLPRPFCSFSDTSASCDRFNHIIRSKFVYMRCGGFLYKCPA